MLRRRWFSSSSCAITIAVATLSTVVAIRDTSDDFEDDTMEVDSPRRSPEVSSLHPVFAHLEGTPFVPGVMHGTTARQWARVVEQGSKSSSSALSSSSSHYAHYTQALQAPQNHTVLTKMPWDEGVSPLVQCGQQLKEISAQSEADAMLNNATKTFCDAGLNKLVEFYVHPAFQANFDRLRGDDGWINQAYVSYMGLKAEEDKIAAEEHLLVQSVHHFSDYPVLVANFGDRVPAEWTAETYPRLVLLQGHNTQDIHKSFNFNKFTAMLFTKVKSGMVLDADQFVNVGVDSMLSRAAEETTKDYPYPIMPVHWMSRDPASDDYQGYVWKFKSESAPKQNLRWGHAHPTWSFYALPWLATWSTMFLARDNPDVHTPAWLKEQGFLEDEDLMNVALWATPGALKQWCKYDIASPADYTHFLHQDANFKGFGHDKIYYPKGIPLVFFTAHNAKRPDESYSLLGELWDGAADKRKAIMYDGKWFGSNADLHAYDSSVKCIV